MERDQTQSQKLSALVSKYSSNVVVNNESSSLLVPANRFSSFKPFYYTVGKRFATPVDVRLQGPLKKFNLGIDHIDLKNILIGSIKHGSESIMRSAFLEDVVTSEITGFTGMAHHNAVFKSGPPNLYNSGFLFDELMDKICDICLNCDNLPLSSV